MFTYFAYRVLVMIPTLLVISVITFIIIQLPPGDYLSNQMAEMIASGDRAALEKLAFLRQEFGLDRPMLEQYAVWLGIWPGGNGFSGILQGDLGWSFEYNLPVDEVVGDRLFLSLVLNFTTMLFVYAVSFPIGVYTAVRQYSLGDHVMTFVGYIGLATPNFLLALILLFLAKKHFGVSIGGLMDEQFIDQDMSWGKFISICEHMVVPVIVIGTSGTAGMIRRLRANLLDELQKQYVVTARAKGLKNRRLLLKYPLRMALNPFVADIGNLLPQMISGSAIVAVVMSLPTSGPMLVSALQSQDQYLAGSFLLFLAALTVIGMFVSDLALAALDPRIRLGSEAAK
ncbi:MAG: ABC transporter permease [Alphaproteobacteria bacterium]|jgi:peptide/nickel transport system permease protein|nr:ABC transporter permease [Rhodospirillaceae bacterium]MDP6022199.1 ABC transporter permease [Alphaproteobacteria bacterium]MDP6255601.1 ABC transporter permease [Alphaproteobacteria bacterium]MDP7053747.1 ABC transporter permease [Alphaproteobacteria bacterium]MDP7227940.1 ABC transporter permease [Alphaproteobacteria bacterium]|tara:strand:+ start:15882 stop:16907 length:1026 start_codon:yes stop_codon:yes gene_type:complete